MEKPKIKIFLSYHKPSTLLKSDVFVPIHVGRAIKEQRSVFDEKWLNDNLAGDDTGVSISNKNLNYCELTAQYWAWKNLSQDVDFVGFMHYRRHLNFSNNTYQENRWGLIEKDFIDANYINAFGLDDKNIQDIVPKYDVITAKRWDVLNVKSKSNFDHYATSDPKLHIKDYESALKILKSKYPEYSDSIQKYNDSHYGYYTNIFVMRREIFDNYCSWLFDILFELEKKLDISEYDYQEARIYGYISEWLFGIYITHLQDTTDLNIREMQRTIVNYTDVQEPIYICFASDDCYAKYMGVTICSILINKKPSDDLHIYVLDGNISDKKKNEILSLMTIAPFTIEYLHIDEVAFDNFPLRGSSHFSIVTWYRLFLPSVLPNIDRLIYLDSDIVVNSSLWPLYNQDISDQYVCGVIDIMEKQNSERLQISKYVNAGVLLLNLKKMRENNIQEKFFTYVKKNKNKIVWNDQDVINVVCNNNMKYLDPLWNVQITDYKGNRSEYFKSISSNAHIIHFVSNKKPWKNSYGKWNRYYYQYLKFTPWKKGYPRYYWTLIIRYMKILLKVIFSIENVEKGEKKQLCILGLRFLFIRNTVILRHECEDLRLRLDKTNALLEEIKREIHNNE